MPELVINPKNGQRRVVVGRRGPFTRFDSIDIYAGIRRGVQDGQSDFEIAYALGISERTVMRYRHRHGLPSLYGVVKEPSNSQEES